MSRYAFMEEDEDGAAVWIGTCLEEYPTLEDLFAAAKALGCEIQDLSHEAIVAMLAEAGHRRPPRLGERHGIVF